MDDMAKKMTFGGYITQTLLVVVPVSLLFGYGRHFFWDWRRRRSSLGWGLSW